MIEHKNDIPISELDMTLFSVNPENRQIISTDEDRYKKVRLSKGDLKILMLLIDNAGGVVENVELTNLLFSNVDKTHAANALKQAMFRFRKKLGEVGDGFAENLQTYYATGYCWRDDLVNFFTDRNTLS